VLTKLSHEKKHDLEFMGLGLIGLSFFALGFVVFPEPTFGLSINIYVVIGFLFFGVSFMKPLYSYLEKRKK